MHRCTIPAFARVSSRFQNNVRTRSRWATAYARITAGTVRGVLTLGVRCLRALSHRSVRCTSKNAPSIAARGVSLQPPIRIIESTPRMVNNATHEVPIIKTRANSP